MVERYEILPEESQYSKVLSVIPKLLSKMVYYPHFIANKINTNLETLNLS